MGLAGPGWGCFSFIVCTEIGYKCGVMFSSVGCSSQGNIFIQYILTVLDCDLDVFKWAASLSYKKFWVCCVKLRSCCVSYRGLGCPSISSNFFLICLHTDYRLILPERLIQVRLNPGNKFVWGRKNWLLGVLTFPSSRKTRGAGCCRGNQWSIHLPCPAVGWVPCGKGTDVPCCSTSKNCWCHLLVENCRLKRD